MPSSGTTSPSPALEVQAQPTRPQAVAEGDANVATMRAPRRPWPWLLLGLLATVAVVAGLAAIPHRQDIPPQIGADNAYIFLAADRLYAGQGLTSIPPRAPLQPWDWHGDWCFLTQWPAGYPLLICAVRAVLRATTAAAAVWIALASCGVALVAWFAFARKCLPRRLPAMLIAAVAAAASFSIGNVVNPSSDTVLLALTPLVMLGAVWGITPDRLRSEQPGAWRLALIGLAAGVLFWIRYAALFLPVALGVFIVVRWLAKQIRLRHVAVYAACSLLPIVTLLVANRTLGDQLSMQEQLNLGHRMSFELEPGMLATAWRHFSAQTLYAHRPEAAWFFAIVLPAGAVVLPLVTRASRRRAKELFASPPVILSVIVVATLFAFLIASTALFHGKYDYVDQPRYYQPIRPLYFVLILGPIVILGPRVLRALACIPLIAALLWFGRQDAARTYARWLAADRPATAYSRWSQHFEPGARSLYDWLAARRGPDLVVFSNFHEEIALETGIPACPTPPGREQLDEWLARIRAARHVDHLRVLFVLDPSNGYRDYYLVDPEAIVERFGLRSAPNVPAECSQYVFTPALRSAMLESGKVRTTRPHACAPTVSRCVRFVTVAAGRVQGT